MNDLMRQEVALRLAEEPPLPRSNSALILSIRTMRLKMELAQKLFKCHGPGAANFGGSRSLGSGGYDDIDGLNLRRGGACRSEKTNNSDHNKY